MAILFAVGCLCFWIHFNSTPHAPDDSGKIRYYYGGEQVRAENIEACIIDGVPFLCFNDLSEYLDMSETGGAAGLKFLFRSSAASDSGGTGKEEYVIFPTDAKEVNVNGQIIPIDGMNRIVGDEVWVSTHFIVSYMRGISVEYNENKQEIRVSRLVDEANSTDKVTAYLSVEFTLKSTDSLNQLTETGVGTGEENGDNPVYELNFTLDLSEYEKYMDPMDRDGYLTLVNTIHLLDQSYTPSDLMDCKYTAAGRSTQQLRLCANMALEALMKEMQAAGFHKMAVYSGFRSYSYQNLLFNQYTDNELANNPYITREQAESIVLTYSTRPGTSEHQTGLAVDMDTMGTFSTDFEYEDEYKWLQENAWKFGFILRYPKDKVYVTTIQFEPWHYRFVGRYHAKKIHDSGMCLEEYVESLRNQQNY